MIFMKRIFTSLVLTGLVSSFALLSKLNSTHNENNIDNVNNLYFRSYNKSDNNSIYSNNCSSVSYSNNNDFAIGTDNGFSVHFNNSSAGVYYQYNTSILSGPMENDCRNLVFNDVGDIFVTTSGGLIHGTLNGNKNGFAFQNYFRFFSQGLSNFNLYSVATNAHHLVAVTTKNHVEMGWRSNPIESEKTEYLFKDHDLTKISGAKINVINDIKFDNNGNIFAATNSGIVVGTCKPNSNIYEFKLLYQHNTSNEKSLLSNNCLKLCFGSDNKLGVVTDQGVSIGTLNTNGDYSFTNFSSSNKKIFPSNISLTSCSFDKKDNIFLGSKNNGLFFGTSNDAINYKFKNYTINSNESIASNTINNLTYGNSLAIATDKGFSVSITPLANIIKNDIIYDHNIRNKKNININSLLINFNLTLNNLISTANVGLITIQDSKQNIVYADYLTKTGEKPDSSLFPDINAQQTIDTKANANSHLQLKNISGSDGNGLSTDTDYFISVNYGTSSSKFIPLINKMKISTPSLMKYNNECISHSNINLNYDFNDRYYHTSSNIRFNFSHDIYDTITNNNYVEFQVYNVNNYIRTYPDIIYLTKYGKMPSNSDSKNLKNSNVVDIDMEKHPTDDFVNIGLENLKPNSKYNIFITYGSNSDNRLNILSNKSSIAFATGGNLKPKHVLVNWEIALIAVLSGIILIGTSIYFIYRHYDLVKKKTIL